MFPLFQPEHLGYPHPRPAILKHIPVISPSSLHYCNTTHHHLPAPNDREGVPKKWEGKHSFGKIIANFIPHSHHNVGRDVEKRSFS